jgi:putative FmdB family regulatory protein
MPIYAYRCAECGHAKDVLQKMSDPVLTTCPACGKESFSKQLTAAGFQLKGSGWYVTDFRGGNTGGSTAAKSSEASAEPAKSESTATASTSASSGGDSASAGSCGSSCACH